MESKYIAAIEIGSSKIKGIVAAVTPTADIEVIAVESSDAGAGVQYGRVQNAREVSSRINDIMRRLENNPRLAQGTITNVFVADGGRSVCSTRSEGTVRQGADAEITTQTLERLRKDALFNLATDRTILEVAARRYLVDNGEVKKVLGAFGNVVKGEFTVVTASPENRRALDRVKIESRGIDVPRCYIPRPIALSETVLSASDRQVGCLLVDFGAETTTLTVYRDNALQMATILPMGSSNINLDLCSGLSITEESAENFKLSKGEVVIERVNIDAPDDETREVINYVSARAGEIIANINNQLSLAGFKPQDLAAGIVLAGGGSRLKGFAEMLEAQSKMKVRRAAINNGIGMPAGTSIADHIDVLALVRYCALHYNIDCITFPVEQMVGQQTVTTVTTDNDTTFNRQPQGGKAQPAGRKEIDEDDPGILTDDDDIDQDDNVNNLEDLPRPKTDSNKTRRSLLARIQSMFATTSSPLDNNLD